MRLVVASSMRSSIIERVRERSTWRRQRFTFSSLWQLNRPNFTLEQSCTVLAGRLFVNWPTIFWLAVCQAFGTVCCRRGVAAIARKGARFFRTEAKNTIVKY